MKAIIPCAGLGTRFLPVTKVVPKELLPIVDQPVIHLIVEEAIKAGINGIVFITAQGKSAIEDYFDYSFQLEYELETKGKEASLEQIKRISNMLDVISVRQKKPLGLGHAILCARKVIGSEPFAVMLGDDIVDSEKPGIEQLKEVHNFYGKSVVALREIPDEDIPKFGIVGVKKKDGRVVEISKLVEKPSIDKAPSNLAIIGRYVLNFSLFALLKGLKPHQPSGEIQLTDALEMECNKDGLIGYLLEGDRFDAGNRLELIQATITYALRRGDLKEPLLAFLRDCLAKY